MIFAGVCKHKWLSRQKLSHELFLKLVVRVCLLKFGIVHGKVVICWFLFESAIGDGYRSLKLFIEVGQVKVVVEGGY